MKNWARLCCVVVFTTCLSSSVPAQVLQRRDPPAAVYVLGPGDQIVIHITDMEEISDKPVRIDANGFVDLPLAGRMQASGLTVEQFKNELAGKLSKYINAPQISINLTEDQSRPVSVIGAVNTPGVHQLQGPRRLIDVISLSGGVRPDAGAKVIVTRQIKWGVLPLADARTDPSAGVSTATLSLDSLLSSKDPAQNILVEPNDIVSIPKGDLVYVVGDVKKAGGVPLSSHESVSLLQAMSLAEGMGPDASPKHAKILRPAPGGDGTPKEIPIDIQKILAGEAPDVPLYADDVLFVPNSTSKVATRRVIETAVALATGILIYRR